MPDDKTKQDNRDRQQVAGGEDYEVQHFAGQAGISIKKARELIEKHGNDRETLLKKAKSSRA